MFCPASIYFHSLEYENEDLLSKDTPQINGSNAHKNSDAATYSSKRSMLQAVNVYSYEYDIYGKIDTFDIESGILTERKKKIRTVYDGYIFQLYAQYFALSDMGYDVKKIRLYSMDDNKTYNILKPDEDIDRFNDFKKLISDIKEFKLEAFKQVNMQKCLNCIYEPLCSCSALKEVM